MANFSTPDNNQEILIKLTEILESLVDASASAKHFSDEVSSASQSTSKMKKDAQEAMGALFSTTKKNVQASEELHAELENLSRELPNIIKGTMSTIESGFAFTTGKMNMGYLVEKWTNPIFNEYKILQRKTLNEFDDQLEQIEKALREAADEQTRTSLEVQKSMVQERRTSIANATENQLMARDNANFFKTELFKAGKQIISKTFTFFQQKVTSAIDNYKNTMQQTYTTIQSYNNYTEKQYDALFKRLKKSITDMGLENVININEVQEAYTNTLKGGLRGEIAEKQAYYSKIGEQAGITFDWADSSWLKTVSRMDKAGNNMDEFFQNIITTTENISEAVGHDFMFTNGQINAMVDSLNTLQQVLGLTDDAYVESYKSFATVGAMLSEQNIDATKIYSDITKYVTDGYMTAGNSVATILHMGGRSEESVKDLITSGDTQQISLDYLKSLESMYNKTTRTFKTNVASQLNESLTNVELEAYERYLSDLADRNTTVEEEFARIYNYDEWAYNKMIESLENSETQTDQLQNSIDNWFAEWGKWANQNPILSFLAGTLLSTVTNIGVSYFAGGKGSVGGRTINNLLSKLFGKGGEAAANAATNASTATPAAGQYTSTTFKLKNGTTRTNYYQYADNGVGGLKKVRVTNKVGEAALNNSDDAAKLAANYGDDAAKLAANYGDDALRVAGKGASSLGKVGKFAGKALGAVGTVFTIGSAIYDGYKGYQEDGADGAARNIITGTTEVADSGKDVASSATSGALTGAGFGLIFGPWGAAIGAAVGGLLGLAVSLNDLNDEELQYRENVKRLNSVSQALAESEKNRIELSESLETTESLVEKAKAGEQNAIKELAKTYPVLNKYIGESTEGNEEYARVLDSVIALEQKKTFNQIYGYYGSAYTEAGWTGSKVTDTGNSSISKIDNGVKVSGFELGTSSADFSNISPKQVFSATGNGRGGSDMTVTEANLSDAGFSGFWDDGVMASYVYTDDDNVNHTMHTRITRDDAKNWISSLGLDVDPSIIDKMTNEEFAGFLISSGIINNDYLEEDGWNTEKAYEDFIKNAKSEHDTAVDSYAKMLDSLIAPSDLSYALSESTKWNDLRFVDENGKAIDKKATLDTFFATLKELKDYNDKEPQHFETSLGISYDDLKNSYLSIEMSPLKVYEKYNDLAKFSYKPPFAVGTVGDYSIPYDNYPALLHKGEQIRTAAEVAVERAEQHVASSDTIGQLNSVVVRQTDTIINLLNQILNVTNILAGRNNKGGNIAYDYSLTAL